MAGRKKKLTEKLFDKLLNLIADGLTIREVFSRDDVDFTWQSFRNYVLMSRYIKAKELAVDLRLSELEDKRKELEIKIESGELDAKAAQNLVNLYKIIVASSQWSASKLNAKRYGKSAEVLSINSEKNQPLTISWSKP